MHKLTHLDSKGNAKMVDVGDKQSTQRIAIARGVVRMAAATLELIAAGGHKKGDVLAIARIAGIQAAKSCSQLIPLCHPLMLSAVDVDLELDTVASRRSVRCLFNLRCSRRGDRRCCGVEPCTLA